ncbi:conserved hypothetical protein [Burkholderiales bacterium 8X]|nr:conserved hypothetical protein [Burkholderiales bacterium 8X]
MTTTTPTPRPGDDPAFDESIAGEEDPGASTEPLAGTGARAAGTATAAGPTHEAAGHPFVYRGFHFVCRAEPQVSGVYRPLVTLLQGGQDGEKMALPQDIDPYNTEQEALRHAEQQAMRWVHDRSGDPRGQF